MTGLPPHDLQRLRYDAMAILAHTAGSDIAARLNQLSTPGYATIRAPQCGLVMLRGRIGGDGAPFNIGEATVARAAVRLDTGEIGFGYTLGRDTAKAVAIALCDALLQTQDHAALIETRVLSPLRKELAGKRARQASETAATRVDFYTLVRGEA